MANANTQYYHGLRHVLIIIAVLLVMLEAVPGVMGQKGRKNQEGVDLKPTDVCDDCDKCIWTMHIGNLVSKEQYVDPITEEIKGFEVDIINAVCRIANKTCELVFDIGSNCWDSGEGGIQRGGIGILSRYYDACVGWLPTYTRNRTVTFTDSHSKNRASGFFVRPGNANFNWRDLTGKKIGFIYGFFSTPSCVLQQSDRITGADLPDDNVVFYLDRDQLIAGVLAGEVDAAFDSELDYRNSDVLQFVTDEEITCAFGGSALMTRKDSCLRQWYNRALKQLLSSPEYLEICNDLQAKHGGVPGPDKEDLCIGL